MSVVNEFIELGQQYRRSLNSTKNAHQYIYSHDKEYIRTISNDAVLSPYNKNIAEQWDIHDFTLEPLLFLGNLENAKIIFLLSNPGNQSEHTADHNITEDSIFNQNFLLAKSGKKEEHFQGAKWANQSYENAFWENSFIEQYLITNALNPLISMQTDKRYIEYLRYSFWHKTNKKIAQCFEAVYKNDCNNKATVFSLGALYKKICDIDTTSSQIYKGFLIKAVRKFLIDRYAATAEYYPYHSQRPCDFSVCVRAHTECKPPDKYCLPSTYEIMHLIENRLRSNKSDNPIIILPRKKNEDLWLHEKNLRLLDNGNKLCSLPLNSLKGYNKLLIGNPTKNRRNPACLFKPENLVHYNSFNSLDKTYVNAQVKAQDLLHAALREIVLDLQH